MSEDCHSTERYYECTCCNRRSEQPVACGCADEYCHVCHRCRTCCSAPGVHIRIESLVRSEVQDALRYLLLYGPVSAQDQAAMFRRAVPHASEQVQREDEARKLTSFDLRWLKTLCIRADEDIARER